MDNRFPEDDDLRNAGALPKALRRLRRISRDVTTSLMFKMFIREKKSDSLEKHYMSSSAGSDNQRDCNYYSRHHSIFEYTETPQIESNKNNKKFQRNYSLDLNTLNTIKHMNKLVYGSTKLTNHSEKKDSQHTQVFTYSKVV